jgi:hypothetical protein
MNFKQFYEKTLSDRISDFFTADVGKHAVGALKGLDPFGKQGLVSKAAAAAKKAENYLKTGGTEKERNSVEKWRDYKIYPQDSNTAFNTQVESILNLNFPIKPKDQPTHFAKWVVKRNSPIKYASHIANLVMDQYVKNIQKQIPKDRALQFALDDTILNDELKRWLQRSGMIDAV